MAQEKEERSGRTTSAHSTSAQSRSGPREAAGAAESGLTAAAAGRRPERYVIGIRALPAQPFAYPQQSMDEVVEYLGRMEDVEVVKRIRLGSAQSFTTGLGLHEVVVARFDEARAQRLRAAAPPHLIIEPDWLLADADCLPVATRATPIATLLPLRSVATDISVRVVGERDQPLARAIVVIEGGGFPAQALTDDSGTARITFFGGPIEAIQTLFVRAAANHWDRLLSAPRLSSGTNTVRLRSLSELHPNFPSTRLLGWGQRLMGLNPTGGRFTGSGVRIGVIDSGCDISHPLLRRISHGKDFTSGGTDTSWSQDLLSNGTHSAGIINAASADQGIVGCAPEAELHVFKVLPHGRISDLLAALHECIERELDLIHISVVSDSFSELVAQKLREARLKGIACIAAAGNTAGPVAFPAMLPGVMAVAAVGRLREFPSDSSHVLNVLPHLIGSDDIFAAGFSAAGPQVAVSAPGVAVVSTVPGGGYAAADRTATAAAHVTGLAALVLAHHPAFQDGSLRARSEQRVHALFELIRASAVPRFADPQHGGAGVPYLPRIPGSHGLVMGLAATDGVERIAMPQYWPGPVQGWPAWLQPPASGFF